MTWHLVLHLDINSWTFVNGFQELLSCWLQDPFRNCDVTHPDYTNDDPEVKQILSNIENPNNFVSTFLNRFAQWNHLKLVIAWCLKFITRTQNRTKTKSSSLSDGKTIIFLRMSCPLVNYIMQKTKSLAFYRKQSLKNK